jgi:L-rhamnose mutarotase
MPCRLINFGTPSETTSKTWDKLYTKLGEKDADIEFAKFYSPVFIEQFGDWVSASKDWALSDKSDSIRNRIRDIYGIVGQIDNDTFEPLDNTPDIHAPLNSILNKTTLTLEKKVEKALEYLALYNLNLNKLDDRYYVKVTDHGQVYTTNDPKVSVLQRNKRTADAAIENLNHHMFNGRPVFSLEKTPVTYRLVVNNALLTHYMDNKGITVDKKGFKIDGEYLENTASITHAVSDLTNLSNRLKKRIGATLEFVTDNPTWVTRFYNGKIYINTNSKRFNLDSPWHEIIAHPVIEDVYKNNPKLYRYLKNELTEDIKASEIIDLLSYVKTSYNYKGPISKLINDDNFVKEALSVTLSVYLAKNEQDRNKTQPNLFRTIGDIIISIGKKLSIQAAKFYNALVEDKSKVIKTQEIPPNTSLRDLSHILFLDNAILATNADYTRLSEYQKDSVFNKQLGLDTTEDLPFTFSKDVLLSTPHAITALDKKYKTGTYKIGDKYVKLTHIEAATFSDHLYDTRLSKPEFLENYYGPRKWISGEYRKQHIYHLELSEEADISYDLDTESTAEEINPTAIHSSFKTEKINIIKRLNKKINEERYNKLRLARLEEMRRQVQQQLDFIDSNKIVQREELITSVKVNTNAVNTIIQGDPSSYELEDIEDLYKVLDGLKLLLDYISKGVDISKLDTDDQDYFNKLAGAEKEILNSQKELKNFSTRMGVATIKETLGVDLTLNKTAEGMLVPSAAKDINMPTAQGLSAGVISNPIVSTIVKKVREAQSVSQSEIANYKRNSKAIFDEFINYQKSQGITDYEKMWEMFINDEGDHFSFVNELTKQYDEDLKDIAKPDGKKGTYKDSTQMQAIKWLRDNHKMSYDKDAYVANIMGKIKSTLKYYKYNATADELKILEDYTTTHDKAALDKALRKYYKLTNTKGIDHIDQYIPAMSASVDIIEAVDLDKAFEIVKRTKSLAMNDDIQYAFNALFTIRGINIKYNKDVVQLEVISDKYLNDKYKDIKNLADTDPRKKMYTFLKNTLEKYTKVYGDDRYGSPFSTLPEKSRKNGIVQQVRKFFSFKEELRDYVEEISAMTGERIKILKPGLHRTGIPKNELSLNLKDVMEAFVSDAAEYKEYNAIIGEVNILKYMVKQQKYFEIGWGTGKPKIDKNTKEVQYKQDGTSNTYLSLMNFLNTVIYKDSQEVEGTIGDRKVSKENQKKIDALKSEIDTIAIDRGFNTTEEYLEALDLLPTNQYEQVDHITVSKLKDIETISARKEVVTIRKTANNIINWTRLKLLGLRLIGGPSEVVEGLSVLSLISSSGAKEYFNEATFVKAIGQATSATVDKGLRHKLVSALNFLNISDDNAYDRDLFESSALGKRINDVAFSQYTWARKFINKVFIAGIMQGERFMIKDLNGEEHKLWDVLEFDKDGNLEVPDTFPKNIFLDKDGRPTPLKLEIEFFLRETLTTIRENDNKTDPLAMNRSTVGRVIGMFRSSWWIRKIYWRFGEYSQYNEETGEHELIVNPYTGMKHKGFYRSVFSKDLWSTREERYDPFLKKTVVTHTRDWGKARHTLLRASFANRMGLIKGDSQVDELTEKNVKMFMREMTHIIMFTMLSVMLKAIASGMDDDDDELSAEKAAVYFAMNVSSRGLRDVSAYINPSSATSILRNITPIVSTLDDASQLTVGLASDIISEDYVGDAFVKWGNNAFDAIPFLRQVPKFIEDISKTKTPF